MVEGAAAHEGERRDLERRLLERLADAVEPHQLVERVVQRPQVRVDLLRQVAGQEAEPLAGLDRGPGQDDALHRVALERVDRAGDREVGLAGAGRADAEGDVVAEDVPQVPRPGSACGRRGRCAGCAGAGRGRPAGAADEPVRPRRGSPRAGCDAAARVARSSPRGSRARARRRRSAAPPGRRAAAAARPRARRWPLAPSTRNDSLRRWILTSNAAASVRRCSSRLPERLARRALSGGMKAWRRITARHCRQPGGRIAVRGLPAFPRSSDGSRGRAPVDVRPRLADRARERASTAQSIIHSHDRTPHRHPRGEIAAAAARRRRTASATRSTCRCRASTTCPALGEKVTLLTHFVVREDAQVLFGFLTHEERATFRLLVKISGVGPRTALSILSGLSVDELAQAISLQESGRLIKVPGIGKKTAERLLLELKGKLGDAVAAPASVATSAPGRHPAGPARPRLQRPRGGGDAEDPAGGRRGLGRHQAGTARAGEVAALHACLSPTIEPCRRRARSAPSSASCWRGSRWSSAPRSRRRSLASGGYAVVCSADGMPGWCRPTTPAHPSRRATRCTARSACPRARRRRRAPRRRPTPLQPLAYALRSIPARAGRRPHPRRRLRRAARPPTA